MGKIVRLPGNFRGFVEVFGGGRRGGFPFEAGGGPGVGSGDFAVLDGPGQIDHGQQIAQGENGSASGGHDVKHLKFRGITVVAAGLTEIAEDELREKSEVEADEEGDGGNAGEKLGIHPAGDFGPPEVEAANVAHDGAANHDVVEMGDDELGVVEVDIQAEAGEEESSEAADEEQADKAEGVEHGRFVGDGALI